MPASPAMLARARAALDTAVTLPELTALVDQTEVVRVAARKAHLSRQAANEWAVLRLEAVRKAGSVLAAMQADGSVGSGRGGDRSANKTTLLAALGAPTQQAAWARARRWQELAAWSEEDFRAWLGAMHEGEFEITEAAALRAAQAGNFAGLWLSDTDDWLTPTEVLDRVLEVFGEVDLDPCSNSIAHPRVPARRHLARQDDGLAHDWEGRVFMNPPYGRDVALWVAKLAGEMEAGRVTEAIALVAARTDTGWFRALPMALVCFPAGRLSFSDHETPAPFPSAISYAGPRPEAFTASFASLGPVFSPVR